MNVSPPRNGNQPPHSYAQMPAQNTDQTSVVTLKIHPTLDNTLDVGRELLLDVLHVQENWNSTSKKMLVSSKENTSLSQSTSVKVFNFHKLHSMSAVSV